MSPLNGGSFVPSPIRRFTSAPLNPFWFDVGTPFPVSRALVGGSSSLVTSLDASLNNFVSATTCVDYNIPVVAFTRGRQETITITSSNPTVATVVGSRAVHQSSGLAVITVASPSRSLAFTLSFYTRVATFNTLDSWVTGSLAKNCTDAIDSRLVGKTAAAAKNLFTSRNHTTQAYVRNPNAWCADLNLTCKSVWNSDSANLKTATLISPRHVLMPAHWQIGENHTLRFVQMNGTVVTRTLLKKKTHPLYFAQGLAYPDLTVGVLNADVPAGISFAKVAPNAIEAYLPNLQYGIPSICIDQDENAIVTDTTSMVDAVARFVYGTIPTASKRLEFYEEKVTYDSGSPRFFIINNELVLTDVLTYAGPGWGTDVGDHIADINQLISDVDTLAGNGDTGYTVTQANLSGFPSY